MGVGSGLLGVGVGAGVGSGVLGVGEGVGGSGSATGTVVDESWVGVLGRTSGGTTTDGVVVSSMMGARVGDVVTEKTAVLAGPGRTPVTRDRESDPRGAPVSEVTLVGSPVRLVTPFQRGVGPPTTTLSTVTTKSPAPATPSACSAFRRPAFLRAT